MKRLSFICSYLAKNFFLYLTSTLILALFFSAQSCKSPTGPKTNSPPDTTSNNFTFQTFTFGASNAGSSYLQDVAIVSDSDIWCVGAVYLDSADGAPDPNAYNAVHWDGSKWELKKIQFYTFCGQHSMGSYPAKAVLSLGDSVIWIASNNSQIAILSGDKQTGTVCIPVSVTKMWATNDYDVYTVGAIGQIGHYQNGIWQKIESGTNMNIYDIWGASNPQTGKTEILAVASYPDTSAQRKIIQINGSSVSEISSSGISWDLESVWFKPQSQYFVAGTGIYDKHLLSDSIWSSQYYNVTNNYINCIRGNDVNDIVAVGSFGEVIHYNGMRWKSYIGETGLTNGQYVSVAIKGNEIVAVGYNGKAVILVGRR